jgi:hypothetical protein
MSPPHFRTALTKSIFVHGDTTSKRVSFNTARAMPHVNQAGVQLAEGFAKVHCMGE